MPSDTLVEILKDEKVRRELAELAERAYFELRRSNVADRLPLTREFLARVIGRIV